MEFEDVSENPTWEARRVAAAFGVEIAGFLHTDTRVDGATRKFYGARVNTGGINWECQESVCHLSIHEPGKVDHACRVTWYKQKWVCSRTGYQPHNELMARALYRLGFEDECVLAEFPELSAHEKLELRLSLPREFWPQKWRDEEAAQ